MVVVRVVELLKVILVLVEVELVGVKDEGEAYFFVVAVTFIFFGFCWGV